MHLIGKSLEHWSKQNTVRKLKINLAIQWRTYKRTGEKIFFVARPKKHQQMITYGIADVVYFRF